MKGSSIEADEAKLFQELFKAKTKFEDFTSVTKHTALIDCFIHVGILEQITVSRIVKAIENLYGEEIANQTNQLKQLIYDRFDKYQEYKKSANVIESESKKRKASKELEKTKTKQKPTKRRKKSKEEDEPKKYNGLDKKVYVGPKLANLIGEINSETNELWNRKEITSRVWRYVKENGLQNPKDGREVLVQKDSTFATLFPEDMETLSMFTMQKYIQKHISSEENHVFTV